jgi:transposase
MRPCEFGIPTVYKPNETIRTLRRVFASYNLLNRQIRMLKNTIQATLTEGRVTLSSNERSRLFKGKESVCNILGVHRLSEVIVDALQIQVDLFRFGTTVSRLRRQESSRTYHPGVT